MSLREILADLCHEQWSGWMRYVFGKCECWAPTIGPVQIPSWAVARWMRQMSTPYAELSESEQDSDRREADRFLAIIEPMLAGESAALERVAELEAELRHERLAACELVRGCTDADRWWEALREWLKSQRMLRHPDSVTAAASATLDKMRELEPK
jgi:hypothetical protein